MSNEFNAMEEEVEEVLYQLIDLGLVEAHSIDENGSFIYNLTDKGREIEDE